MSDREIPASDGVTYFACGPSNETCKCTCGVEGVPHVCEHKWDGWHEWEEPGGGGGGTAVCSRCGITAMSHSMWVGP